MKKKITALYLALVMGMSALSAFAQGAAPEKTAELSPVEETMPEPLEETAEFSSSGGSGTPVMTIPPDAVPSEEFSYMEISNRATRYDSATVGITVALTEQGAGEYEISAQYRLPGFDPTALTFTVILNYGEETRYLTLPVEDRMPVGEDWTELSGSFPIDPAGLFSAELKLADDFELAAGEYQAPVQVRKISMKKNGTELLYNGKFLTGLEGWRPNGCRLTLYAGDGTALEDTEGKGYTAPYELSVRQEPARYMRLDKRQNKNASIEQNILDQLKAYGPGKYRIAVTYHAPSEEAALPVSFVAGVRGSEDGEETRWYALGEEPPAAPGAGWLRVTADFDLSWNGDPVYGIFKPVDGTEADSMAIAGVSMIHLASGEELLKNADFSDGANSYDLGWTASGCTPGIVDRENVSGAMLSGYNALLIQRQHEYASPTQSLVEALKEKGPGLYTMTAWYRGEKPGEIKSRYTFALTIKNEEKTETNYYTSHPVIADETGFVKLTSTFFFDWQENELSGAYLKLIDNVDGAVNNTIVTGLSLTAPDGTQLLQNADFSNKMKHWDIPACSCYIMYQDGTVSERFFTGDDGGGNDNIFAPNYSSGGGGGADKTKESKRYLLVDDRANQYVSPEQDITEALRENKAGTYIIRGAYKSVAGSDTVTPTIGVKRKGANAYQYYSMEKKMLTSTRGWGQIRWEASLSWSGEVESAFIKLIDGTGNKNALYVDAFSMKKKGKDQELLINGGFEEGSYGWKDNGCSMTVLGEPLEAEYTQVKPGENCLFIRERQSQYTSGYQDITQALKEQGKGKYEAGVKFRMEAGAQKPTFTLVVKGSKDKDNRYYNVAVNRPVAVHDKWVECKGLFDVEWSGELEYAQFKLVDGFPGADSVYIKDPSLKKMGEEGQLLKNPDFSQGIRDWTAEGCVMEALGTQNIDQDVPARDGFDGENYLFIHDKLDGFASIIQDITLPLRENGQGKYKVSGWYRAPDAAEFVTFTVGLLDDTDQWIYYTLGNDTVYVDGKKWVRLSAEFDLKWQGMLQDAMFKVLDGYRTTSPMYVDDFQFVCESTGTQILRNPSFEGGDAGWTEERVSCTLMDGGGKRKPKTRTEDNGSYLKVYGRDSKYSAPEQVITSALEKNGQGFYEISAWFKPIDGETPVSLTVSVLDETEEWRYFVVPLEQQVVLENGELWYQVRALVDVRWTGELKEAFFKLIDGTNGAESMYVDDVSMKRQDTGVELLRNRDFEQGKLYYRRGNGFQMEAVYR